MNKPRTLVLITSALVFVAVAQAEPARDQTAQAEPPAHGRSFKQDVRDAWSQAGRDARRAGRAIGESARSFGRATRDTAVGGWRKVREAFPS